MCCIKGCLGRSKYFQTKAVFKVLYCLERAFLRTWELAFPVRIFFRRQSSVKISWNSEIWNNTNLSTEAHVPTPRNGQYLRHAHNHVHGCHYSFLVVRILKVLAITRPWYVCFSAEIRFEIPWHFLAVNINLHFWRLEVKNNLFSRSNKFSAVWRLTLKALSSNRLRWQDANPSNQGHAGPTESNPL